MPNQASIYYNVNGGTIRATTTSSAGTTYNWTVDGSGNVLLNGSKTAKVIKYGTPGNLADYNNAKYIYITKTGYHVDKGNEWINQENNNIYNQLTNYDPDAFCDTTNGNCSVTVHVNWKPNTYQVTFDQQGGSSGTETQTVTYDVTPANITVPTRTGYTFQGYFTGTNGSGTMYYNKSGVATGVWKRTSNTTFYAYFIKNDYTVTLSTSCGSVSPKTIKVQFDSVYNHYSDLPKPGCTGHSFLGWYLNDTLIDNNKVVETASNHTLVAKWVAGNYTVSFDANGGTKVNTIMNVTYGEKYGTLPTTSSPGRDFLGWYTEIEGGNKITSTSTVTITQNHTLYAHWSGGLTYTVTFDKVDNRASITSTSKNVQYAAAYGTLPVSTLTGYEFNGWYTNTNYTKLVNKDTIVNISKNHTLYAKYTQKNYTLSFNGNGNTGGTVPSSITFEGSSGTSDISNKI